MPHGQLHLYYERILQLHALTFNLLRCSATSRRPIKGAAQRPIKYSYPDTPVSPLTLERQELERRLVPIKIQILVFFIVALILYFIYVHVEDSSSVLTLLDSLVSDDANGILFQDETLDAFDIGQE